MPNPYDNAFTEFQQQLQEGRNGTVLKQVDGLFRQACDGQGEGRLSQLRSSIKKLLRYVEDEDTARSLMEMADHLHQPETKQLAQERRISGFITHDDMRNENE